MHYSSFLALMICKSIHNQMIKCMLQCQYFHTLVLWQYQLLKLNSLTHQARLQVLSFINEVHRLHQNNNEILWDI